MKKQYLIIYLFFLGILTFTSCSKEVDYFPSVTGNVDPLTIEKASLQAYFPFESKSYSTIKSCGIDSSKVTFGDSVQFVSGQRGYCFQGDTIRSYVQYKLLANSIYQNLKGFTISSWIKVPEVNDNREAQIIMIDGGDSITGKGSLSVSFDSLYLKGYLYSDSIKTNSHEIKTDRSLIKPNVWVHIAFTYNDSTSTMALFANGSLLKEDTCYSREDTIPKIKMGRLKFTKNISKLYIGAWPQQVSGTSIPSMAYFSGYIDEMHIWNKGLTKETVSSVYNAESALANYK